MYLLPAGKEIEVDRLGSVGRTSNTLHSYRSTDTNLFKLYIPSIGLSEIVDTGKDMGIGLRDGLWKIPYTTFPGQGGNTVVVGHSMDYSRLKPPPFFYLDRVEKGDTIYIEYLGETFKYTISLIVKANISDTHYENVDVEEEIITLYTCTPIINPVYRLIIIGKVVSID